MPYGVFIAIVSCLTLGTSHVTFLLHYMSPDWLTDMIYDSRRDSLRVYIEQIEPRIFKNLPHFAYNPALSIKLPFWAPSTISKIIYHLP